MTTNKPEAVSVYVMDTGLTDLVRLNDYKVLQAECEKLRKDAERYRWLREYFCSTREDLDDLLVEACGDNDPSKLDGVIEAALAELERQNKQPIERDKP